MISNEWNNREWSNDPTQCIDLKRECLVLIQNAVAKQLKSRWLYGGNNALAVQQQSEMQGQRNNSDKMRNQ